MADRAETPNLTSQSVAEWRRRYDATYQQLYGDDMNINDAFPSKYLKASDLKGAKVRVTISRVETEDMQEGKQKPVVYFKGKEKGLVLNKTNGMIIASAYGPETNGWGGKEILLYPGKTQFNGQMVDSLKVEIPMSESDDDPGF